MDAESQAQMDIPGPQKRASVQGVPSHGLEISPEPGLPPIEDTPSPFDIQPIFILSVILTLEIVDDAPSDGPMR